MHLLIPMLYHPFNILWEGIISNMIKGVTSFIIGLCLNKLDNQIIFAFKYRIKV